MNRFGWTGLVNIILLLFIITPVLAEEQPPFVPHLPSHMIKTLLDRALADNNRQVQAEVREDIRFLRVKWNGGRSLRYEDFVDLSRQLGGPVFTFEVHMPNFSRTFVFHGIGVQVPHNFFSGAYQDAESIWISPVEMRAIQKDLERLVITTDDKIFECFELFGISAWDN